MPRKSKPAYETEKDTFAVRLRATMDFNGENQSSLARKVDLQRQTIGYYMSGQSKPDTEKLAKIATALHVSADWLIGLTNTPSGVSDTENDSFCGLSLSAVSILKMIEDIGDIEILEFVSYVIEQYTDLTNLANSVHAFCDNPASKISVDFDDYFGDEAEGICKDAAIKALVEHYFWKIVNNYRKKKVTTNAPQE